MTSKHKQPKTPQRLDYKSAGAVRLNKPAPIISETTEDRIARSFADLDRAVREGWQSETDWPC